MDTSKIHLYAKHDTLWYNSRFFFRPLENEKLKGDSAATACYWAAATADRDRLEMQREFELIGEWRPDIEYSLEIDSAAFADIYGLESPTIKKGFKVPSLDAYGTLLFNISGMDGTPCFVELLNSNDKPIKQAPVTSDGTAQFFYLKEGEYYARLIVDRNNNGRWDTGLYEEGLQPEEVFYFNEKVECKAKWDITRNWSPRQRPLDHQKPDAITKQKAEKQKTIQQRNLQRAQKMGIEPPKEREK